MPSLAADLANAATPPELTRQALWALLFGNFVIGTGVMVVPGALNDLSRGLAVPVSSAGQLMVACGPAENPYVWLSWAGLTWVSLEFALSAWVMLHRRRNAPNSAADTAA